MTRRISIITAVAGLALVLAVPVASGQGQPVEPSSSPYPDLVARAVTAHMTAGRSLVFDNRHVLDGDEGTQLSGPYPDVVDRAVAARATSGRSLVFDNHRIDAAQQSAGRTLVFDNYRLDGARPEQVSATSSGREIEWPQLGIGFGLGIVLLLGLLLAIRVSRARPLAH